MSTPEQNALLKKITTSAGYIRSLEIALERCRKEAAPIEQDLVMARAEQTVQQEELAELLRKEAEKKP